MQRIVVAGIFPVPAVFRHMTYPEATEAYGLPILATINVRTVSERILHALLCTTNTLFTAFAHLDCLHLFPTTSTCHPLLEFVYPHPKLGTREALQQVQQ